MNLSIILKPDCLVHLLNSYEVYLIILLLLATIISVQSEPLGALSTCSNMLKSYVLHRYNDF